MLRTTFLLSNGKRVILSPVINFARFAANDVKSDKLPLKTEPVARDNNTSRTLKPGPVYRN